MSLVVVCSATVLKPIRFMYDNWLDDATLTSSSVNSEFPLANFQQIWKKKCSRTTGCTSEWFTADLGSSKAISAFALAFHNFQAGATVHLMLNDTDVWTAPSVDETLTVYSDYLIKMWDTPYTHRYVHWTVVDATNPDAVLIQGRPFIGTWWAPSRNFDNNYKRNPIDPSTKRESITGQISSTNRAKRRVLGYQFTDLSEADRITLEAMFDIVGTSIPYFIAQNPDDLSTRFFYAQNTEDFVFTHVAMEQYFNLNISFKEAQ